MNDMKLNPHKYIPMIEFVRTVISKIKFGKEKELQCDFEKDAVRFITAWKEQFFLKNFDDEWSLLNKNSYEESKEILRKITGFCERYGFKPVLVMPPVSQPLRKYFSEKALDQCVINYVKEAVGDSLPFLNYFDDGQYNDKSLFMNSYFLNKKGAVIFTKRVLNDLGL